MLALSMEATERQHFGFPAHKLLVFEGIGAPKTSQQHITCPPPFIQIYS